MTKLKLTTTIVSISFAATSFGAAKYTKKESEIQATQTALTKPAQVKKDAKARPDFTAEDVFGGTGEKLKQITDAQTKVLKRLIDNTSDTDPEKPDLLFRMAELYNEQQRYYSFKARDLDQKIFDCQQKNDDNCVRKDQEDQKKYQDLENKWLLAAVKQYLEVADHPEKYGSYKKTDEVLFYLAYLLTQVKKQDAALKYFKRLIKDYPKSKFIPDALLSFGEFYFDQKELDNALKFYDKVLQYPESRVFLYAKYKEGWCYYNLGDFKQSLTIFVEVGQTAATSKNKADRPLVKEAKKDIVRAYARVPGANPEKAWPFFQRTGGDYAQTMMEMLGDLYNSQGMFAESIKTFRQLMTIAPHSPRLCAWQTEVMKNTLSMTGSRAAPDTVKELQRLSAVYEMVKDKKDIKKDDLEECRDNTANTLRELATVWHKEAQKTNNMDTYGLAHYLYKEYLARFPKEKDIYVMTFYYAELLFKLGSMGENQKYCDAAPVYTKVVELQPEASAKYLKEAAYAAVISWKNCLSVEDSKDDLQKAQTEQRQQAAAAKKGKKGTEEVQAEKVFAPKTIPDRQKQMIAAFDTYIKYVPDSNELPTIKYRKARIYYEYDHIDEAIPLFKDIAEHHKSSDLAIYSANLLLDCYVIKKAYKEVEAAVEEFLGTPELLKDPEFKANLVKIKAGTIRKHIEELEKENKVKEAADLYYQLAVEYPDDPRIDEVYYNAAVNYEKAKFIGLAIKMREQLISTKPDSTLAKKAKYLIGRNYQDVAAFEKAAENYESFSNKYPGEKDASTALFTASFFRRGLGENDLAMKDTEAFIKLYGPRKEFTDKAAGVAFYQYQIYEQQKNNDALKKHFGKYLKDWGTKGGVDRQIVAHVKLAEILWKESCPVAGVNGACIEVSRVRAAGAAAVAMKAAAKKKGKGKRKKGADLPPQCGPETKSKIAVHDRKPGPMKEAMGHFTAALALFKGGAADKSVPGKDETERSARVTDMNYYAAEAKMVEGDIEYEKFLKMQIPDKLDFSPAPPDASPAKQKLAKKRLEESQKKFKGWLDGKTKQLESARKTYQAVILFKQAHWAIAASARIGQLFQDFSGQLYTAPVPKAGGAPAGMDQAEWETMFHDAYCDAMTDQAEPLENKAIEGLGTCLTKSTELSWFNEWSQLCEGELNQIKPSEYPLASEIRAEPGYVAYTTDRAEVQSLPEGVK